MKIKNLKVFQIEVAQLCPTIYDPMYYSCQFLPFTGFLRQEYWSGLPFPYPGDLPNTGIEPRYPTLQGDSLPSEPPRKLPVSIQKSISYLI